MFYSQPLASRFGTDLITELRSQNWTSLEIAVAWVRASGIAHLEPALANFLLAGGTLSVTVGIDLDNTTKEGLAALLQLAQAGASRTFIHHNEAGSIFHPKLYLFKNQQVARLIVGSNNITEAGLFVNTEAGLQVDASVGAPVIVSASNALASWRDTALGLARELDTQLLNDLETHGYIKDEQTARAEARSRQALARQKSKGVKLFASRSVAAPSRPKVVAPSAPSSSSQPATSKPLGSPQIPATAAPSAPLVGQVLLMRVRKAHATDRPTQTQLPKAVAGSDFFGAIDRVTSVHTGEEHTVRPASARGIVNTLKLEIPEMRHFADPVVRFERTPSGISYEAYDSSSPQGQAIMTSLRLGLGLAADLGRTGLSLPGNPDQSTWWRFV